MCARESRVVAGIGKMNAEGNEAGRGSRRWRCKSPPAPPSKETPCPCRRFILSLIILIIDLRCPL